jgi:hypothetical protein
VATGLRYWAFVLSLHDSAPHASASSSGAPQVTSAKVPATCRPRRTTKSGRANRPARRTARSGRDHRRLWRPARERPRPSAYHDTRLQRKGQVPPRSYPHPSDAEFGARFTREAEAWASAIQSGAICQSNRMSPWTKATLRGTFHSELGFRHATKIDLARHRPASVRRSCSRWKASGARRRGGH